jgi:dihydrofolate reductase
VGVEVSLLRSTGKQRREITHREEQAMSKVFSGASMSLDGYVSGPGVTGFDLLFDWYSNGDVVVENTHPELTWHLSSVSANYLTKQTASTGALIVGRGLFDFTNGWDANHPLGVPVVVMSHRPVPEDWPDDAPFTFVSAGPAAALEAAQAVAGGKNIGVAAGVIAKQFLLAGLLDEIWVDLIPVVLGGGTPYFDAIGAPVKLDGPFVTEQGDRVTHLRYHVVK